MSIKNTFADNYRFLRTNCTGKAQIYILKIDFISSVDVLCMFCAWHQKIKIKFCNIFFFYFHLRPGDLMNILRELQEIIEVSNTEC